MKHLAVCLAAPHGLVIPPVGPLAGLLFLRRRGIEARAELLLRTPGIVHDYADGSGGTSIGSINLAISILIGHGTLE